MCSLCHNRNFCDHIYVWSMVPEGIKDRTNQGFTNISSSRGSAIMFDLSNLFQNMPYTAEYLCKKGTIKVLALKCTNV